MPEDAAGQSLDPSLALRAGASLTPGRPADDALFELLASMACSDGEVHDSELDFLVKIRGESDRDAVRDWALEHAAPIDPDAIAARVADPDDRWKVLRFAARMAWKDGELADEERALLDALALALALPGRPVDRVLHEMAPDTEGRFAADRLLRTVMEIHWDAVQLAAGAIVSEDLKAVTPVNAEVVARVGLDKVEVMALCTSGVVARFQQGAAHVRWSELVTYTRSFGLGASIQLHTEDGGVYSLVDARLSGLGPLLDRLLGARPGPKGDAPNVKALRGD